MGGFYRHFASKRQLLPVLMDRLLPGLENLDLSPPGPLSDAHCRHISDRLRADGRPPGARTDVDTEVPAALLYQLFWRVAETPVARRSAIARAVADLIVLRDPDYSNGKDSNGIAIESLEIDNAAIDALESTDLNS